MTFQEWNEKVRLFWARMRIDRPNLPVFPHFRATLTFVWLVALGGLVYGRINESTDQARSVSLILSTSAWVVASIIVLLKNPLHRLRTLVVQMSALLLLALFVLVLGVTYPLFFAIPEVIISIKAAWLIGVVLLASVVLRITWRVFVPSFDAQSYYPGKVTAPLAFFFLLVNMLWWFGATVMAWLG